MIKRYWIIVVLLVFAASTISLSIVEGSEDTPGSELYYSESNRLQYLVESEFPTDENEIVFNWQYCPINTISTNSATTWTITSTPLIVGGYVYIACGDTIYKLEASSGACVNKVERQFYQPSFFHYLGYGHNTIMDFNAGELFDLDLKRIGQLEHPPIASWYENGMFYGIFKDKNALQLKQFMIQRDAGICNVEYGEWTTDVTGWFRMNGHVSVPIITDTHLFYLSATSHYGKPEKIFLNSVNIATGTKSTLDLELDERYLDDGWLTLYNSTIYLPTYSKGLFDSGGGAGSSITAIKIDETGGMEKLFSYTFAENGITSNFVIHNGRGYINVCGQFMMAGGARASFYVFDMDTFSENCQPVYKVPSAYTHGGIVLNKNYEGDGGNVYIYLVPHTDVAIPGSSYLYVINDNPSKTSSVLQKYTLASRGNSGGYNYSSQAVRTTSDGSMIWYRDIGQVVCFTSIQHKMYHVLLENGDVAKWVVLTEQQLRGIGNDDISVVDKKIVCYNLGGETISDFKMYYYKDGEGWLQARDADLSNDGGGAYSQINTSGGCTINYLILTAGGTPDENSIFHTVDGKRVVLGSYLEDKNLTGVIMTRGEPSIPVTDVDYALNVNVSNTATDTSMVVTISLTEGLEPLDDPRLLVISTYECGFSHNVCPTIGPFINGETTERIMISNQDLLTVSIEVVDGFPGNTYANYGQYIYRADEYQSFDADYSISCDELQDDIFEFKCGQNYNVDFYSDSLINVPYTFIVLNDEGIEIDDVQLSVNSIDNTKARLPDGHYHAYAVLTVTGKSVESCIFSDGGIQFKAKIIGDDPEPAVPDYTVVDGVSANNVYDFVSGQTYLIEYVSSGPREASEFEDLRIQVLNLSTYSVTEPEGYTVTVTDVVIPDEPESGRYHMMFNLTITGPSLGPFDVWTDMKCAQVSNSQSTVRMLVTIIGDGPEPAVPENNDIIEP